MRSRGLRFAFRVVFLCVLALVVAAIVSSMRESERLPVAKVPTPIVIEPEPRREPESFPLNTHMPTNREIHCTGRIDLMTFDPERDLVRIDDDRVWWESDHDNSMTEDDHLVHRSLESRFRQVIDAVCALGGTLEVHDAYRRKDGTHSRGSMHEEGRALDLTCDQISHEKLAKLCWVAGFDWVYHEGRARQGSHVHCSAKR